MTSSFSPDQQRYIDTTGDGEVDTLVLSNETPEEGNTDSVGTCLLYTSPSPRD